MAPKLASVRRNKPMSFYTNTNETPNFTTSRNVHRLSLCYNFMFHTFKHKYKLSIYFTKLTQMVAVKNSSCSVYIQLRQSSNSRLYYLFYV